jgi:urease accessory protein UreG
LLPSQTTYLLGMPHLPLSWTRARLTILSEDQEFLVRHKALPAERIRAIETGGCPHAAVREDISQNLQALEDLHAEFNTQILLIESGGDNLAANYSRELADFIIYVVSPPSPALQTYTHTDSTD